MSASYKLDERIIKNIVRNNTLMVNDNEKFDFVVYYKSPSTKQLIMKNNLICKARLNNSNVIYKFNCPNEDCMLRSVNYVGSILQLHSVDALLCTWVMVQLRNIW